MRLSALGVLPLEMARQGWFPLVAMARVLAAGRGDAWAAGQVRCRLRQEAACLEAEEHVRHQEAELEHLAHLVAEHIHYEQQWPEEVMQPESPGYITD